MLDKDKLGAALATASSAEIGDNIKEVLIAAYAVLVEDPKAFSSFGIKEIKNGNT